VEGQDVEIQCPKCDRRVAAEDVNMARDMAFCRSCNEAFVVSEAMGSAELGDVDFSDPPGGVTIDDLAGRLVLTATCRSSAAAFFVVFALFWNSIVSVFLTLGIHGLISGEDSFDGPFPGFILVFMIPFVLVGVGMGSAALLSLFGQVRVTLEPELLTVFTGVWGIGRSKVADWHQVTAVRIADTGARTNDKPMMAIEVDGPRRFKFGTFLSEERRTFVAAVLRRMLEQRDGRA
jgi:hypothetical protein